MCWLTFCTRSCGIYAPPEICSYSLCTLCAVLSIVADTACWWSVFQYYMVLWDAWLQGLLSYTNMLGNLTHVSAMFYSLLHSISLFPFHASHWYKEVCGWTLKNLVFQRCFEARSRLTPCKKIMSPSLQEQCNCNLFSRIKHRLSYSACTLLWILESVWMYRGH